MQTRGGQRLWALPYPQEVNDIPMIMARHQPLVMGIALHPYLVGQPYRLRHLRRALQHIASVRDAGEIW